MKGIPPGFDEISIGGKVIITNVWNVVVKSDSQTGCGRDCSKKKLLVVRNEILYITYA